MALLRIWFVFALTLSAHLVFSLPSTALFNVSHAIQLSLEVTQLLSEASNFGEYLEEQPAQAGPFGLYSGLVLLRYSDQCHYRDYRSLSIARLEGDLPRVRFINQKIKLAVKKGQSSSAEPELAESSAIIISGTAISHATKCYLVRVGIGHPSPQYVYMILDTGSDISWVKCYVKDGFDPDRSRSYRQLNCDSQECNYLPENSRDCRADKCSYKIFYLDGTSSAGDLIIEKLSFDSSVSFDNMVIGCHTRVLNVLERAIVEPGLLGLGGDMISLVSQLKASSFSYCLVDRDSTLSSTLDFNSSAPSDAVIVPMIQNKKSGMLFFLELTGISVIGQLLPIPPGIFELREDGSGGVLLDSGTHVTLLPTLVFEMLRDSFAQKAESLPPSFNVSTFLETCYDLSGVDTVELPTVAFHFAGDKTVNLLPFNYMLQYEPGIFCFAFSPSGDQATILSNTWHQKMRVNFDITNSVVAFSPNKC